MKSKVIKIKNLPKTENKPHNVNVKPTFFLCILLVIGVIFTFLKAYMMLMGFAMILLSLFALLIMPDRTLVTISDEYLVLYNCSNRDECTLIYWDEIVFWQYEWHGSADLLAIGLIDGSTETQEMFSRRSIARWMRQYANGKEKKQARGRKKK